MSRTRAGLSLLVMAIIPLLMAVVVNIPADAGALSIEVGPTPVIELAPADFDGRDYEVILDTGVEFVGYEASISAIAIVATEPAGSTESPPVNDWPG